MFDLVICGGKILDGTGNPWYLANVAVARGKIVSIGRNVSKAERIIDAEGLMVGPGFIDTHSHSDLMLMAEPEAKQKIMQGITTEIIGQDGLGEAPIRDGLVEDWRKYLSGLNGDPDVDWRWRSFSDYLDRLEEARPATNVVSLVGHGNLRLLAMGMEDRPPSSKELNEMKELLAGAMKEGAFGLSTGLIYSPCAYADTEELIELCRVSSHYGGIFVVHMRNEGPRLLESIEEVASIGREACIPVHISHFKASGEQNWGKVIKALEMLEQARSEGIDVTVDQYPYVAGSTFLSSLLPVWAHAGGTSRLLERLGDSAAREKIASYMKGEGWNRDWGLSWDNVLVTSVRTEGNKRFEGKSVEEIAVARRQSPLEVVFDLILEEENAVTMVVFSMSEDDVRIVMRSPLQMICTDGIVLGKPHPRAYGSFARVLGRYVRDGVIRLEEAVRKMTSLPAQNFGILDRGILRPGLWADITIFDSETVIDMGTYKDPAQFPKGIKYVIVNGEMAVDDGDYSFTRAGRVLRHQVLAGAFMTE